MIGAGIGIVQAAVRGGSFNPLSLFAAAQLGVLYDPRDMSTLWQDTAATIPVTAAGQQVLRMSDLSGNGLDAYRSGGSTGPIFRDSGGLRWLEFNGTTTRMQTLATGTFGTEHISVFAAAANRNTALAGWRGIVELSNDFTAFNNTFTLGYTGGTCYMGSRNTAIQLAAAPGVVNDVPHVYTGLATTSPANCQIRDDGSLIATNVNSQGTLGWYASGPLNIGARGVSGNAASMNFFGLIVRAGLSTPAEIAKVERYLAGLSGVTL